MAAGRPEFVLFGSSVVQMCVKVGGWASVLTDLYDRTADITIRGYGGWNSRNALQVLHKVFPKDAAVQPSLVIVYFGGNDAMLPHPSGLGGHVPLPEYLDNMKKIALHLKSLSEDIRLIFLTSPPVDEEMIRQRFGKTFDNQERTNEACRIYSEALVELCKQMDIKVINLWTAFQNRDGWAAAYLRSEADLAYNLGAVPPKYNLCNIYYGSRTSLGSRDGIHLTSGGSKVVVTEILKVLKEAEWEPSLYWLSMPVEFSDDSPYYPVGADGEATINVSRSIGEWKTEWMDRHELEAFTKRTSVSVPF